MSLPSVGPAVDVELPEIDVAGNTLRLFVESPDFIKSLVEDVRAARERVWIETYTIADAPSVQELIAALKERAAAGVECRLMYDAVGSVSTSGAFFDELRQAGVDVHAYRTLKDAFWRSRFFQRFNRRNHRKLAVIDDRCAYFGGMNLVDQSGPHPLRSDKMESEKTGKPWRDVHVRLEGPKFAYIAAAMEELWARVHKRRRPGVQLWPIRELFEESHNDVLCFDSRPTHKYRKPARVMAKLLKYAQVKIVVAMAYFLPVRSILKQLFRARKRGVDVEIIMPEQSDVPAVQWAARYMYKLLLRRGIRIYEREDRMLHSKVMVVDGRTSVVGSANLDPRSLLINLEFFAVIRSEEFAAALERICVYERGHSRAITMLECEQISWWRRGLHRFAWWFRRLL